MLLLVLEDGQQLKVLWFDLCVLEQRGFKIDPYLVPLSPSVEVDSFGSILRWVNPGPPIILLLPGPEIQSLAEVHRLGGPGCVICGIYSIFLNHRDGDEPVVVVDVEVSRRHPPPWDCRKLPDSSV